MGEGRDVGLREKIDTCNIDIKGGEAQSETWIVVNGCGGGGG